MVTSTMIAPNALKLLLPQSNNQTAAKPVVTISITRNFDYYVGTQLINFGDLERILQDKLATESEPTVSLHVDQSVPMEQVVKVMNIAKRNRYKLILATSPER